MILEADKPAFSLCGLPRDFKGRTRWAMVLEALQRIADIAVQHDQSGIDVHFLVRTQHDCQGITSSSEVSKLLKKIDFKRGGGPTKFVPALQPILDGHVDDFRESKKPKSGTDRPRPLDLVVLTDGVAKDKEKTEKLIVKTAIELFKLRAGPRQVGIQFVQVGEDKNATQFLKHLDNDLQSQNVRDIVDTRPYNIPEGGVPLKDQLARILLGAMDEDIDGEE